MGAVFDMVQFREGVSARALAGERKISKQAKSQRIQKMYLRRLTPHEIHATLAYVIHRYSTQGPGADCGRGGGSRGERQPMTSPPDKRCGRVPLSAGAPACARHSKIRCGGIIVFGSPESDLYTVCGHNTPYVGHFRALRGGDVQAGALAGGLGRTGQS